MAIFDVLLVYQTGMLCEPISQTLSLGEELFGRVLELLYEEWRSPGYPRGDDNAKE